MNALSYYDNMRTNEAVRTSFKRNATRSARTRLRIDKEGTFHAIGDASCSVTHWYPPQSRRFVIIIGYSYRVRSISFDDIVWILHHRVIQQHLYQYHCVVFITSLNGMKIQLKKYITMYVLVRE